MIVVDTNIIHYCWVRGQNTGTAHAVRQRDPEWHAPILWRSELRNVLTAYLRQELLTRAQVEEVLDAASQGLAACEHVVADRLVLDVVENSRLTAHDAEFVALAAALSSPLVTADRAVLSAFPGLAMTMDAFLAA